MKAAMIRYIPITHLNLAIVLYFHFLMTSVAADTSRCRSGFFFREFGVLAIYIILYSIFLTFVAYYWPPPWLSKIEKDSLLFNVSATTLNVADKPSNIERPHQNVTQIWTLNTVYHGKTSSFEALNGILKQTCTSTSLLFACLPFVYI